MSRCEPLISIRRDDLLAADRLSGKDETSWNASNMFLG